MGLAVGTAVAAAEAAAEAAAAAAAAAAEAVVVAAAAEAAAVDDEEADADDTEPMTRPNELLGNDLLAPELPANCPLLRRLDEDEVDTDKYESLLLSCEDLENLRA